MSDDPVGSGEDADPAPELPDHERRRDPRAELHVLVRVQGHDPDGTPWMETGQAFNASADGVGFKANHPIFKGQVLRLLIPLPARLRRYDRDQPLYGIYAIVRGVDADPSSEAQLVRAQFFGQEPPRGYHENPSARFLTPSDLEAERLAKQKARRARPHEEEQVAPADPGGRRQHERFDIFVNFTLQEIDEWGAVLREEQTVAENVSRGGGRLLTAGRYAKGAEIVLREMDGAYETRALVRNVYVGPDGVRRINVKFVDGAPEHLVRKR
jgi:hypothetical protein